jgi:hypothetical protein
MPELKGKTLAIKFYFIKYQSYPNAQEPIYIFELE